MASEKMDSEKQPHGIEAEEDGLESVAAKLGAMQHLEQERIYLKEKNLSYMNNDVDNWGNTILMRSVKLGRDDIVEFLIKCDGLRVNDTNHEGDSAADIAWDEKQFKCLLHLLRGDAEFPYRLDKSEIDDADLRNFLERRDLLHEFIESGDLHSIEEALKSSKPCKYINLKTEPFTKNQSALSWAAECGQIEIFAYLLVHGARFNNEEEESECVLDEPQMIDLNAILSEYFVKLDDSHILKLMHSTHSPQVLTERRREKVRNIYEYLDRSEIVSVMMKVLEYEGVDVVFDFECDHTNRIYCMNNCEIEGLTVTSMKQIFIAARKCEQEEGVNQEVAGTLAHEFAHMAIEVVYKNDAKPYEQWEETKGSETEKVTLYRRIVEEIHKQSLDSSAKVDPIITNAIKNYYPSMWESEVVVRVPHIIGYYGDAKGTELLQSQVQELFQFYLSELMPKFRQYTNPMFFLKHLCIAEAMNRYFGCLTDDDREIAPLKEPAKSFRDFLVPVGILSVIFTSNTKICSMHVYHELKKSYSYHMEKKCLFFSVEWFEQNSENILKAFRSRMCESIVLVSDKEVLRLNDISLYFDDVLDRRNGNERNMQKQVIIVVEKECRLLPVVRHGNVLSYEWNELSEPFMRQIMNQNIYFKGKETNLYSWFHREKVKQIIQSNEILRFVSQQGIRLGDGGKLIWKGFVRDYYIERVFFRNFVEQNVLQELPESAALILTGIGKDDIRNMNGVDETSIHWMDSFLNIDHRKRIFCPLWKWENKEVFTDFCSRVPSIETIYWLHLYHNKLYIRMTKGVSKYIESYRREEVLSEENIISSSKERVIIISDDPGMGKSTVITNIIMRMREAHPDWWVGRIDLNDYSDGKENPLGLANIEIQSQSDYVLEIFIRMLGIKSKLEVCLFREFIRPGGLNVKYKVFLDGYDEVSCLYSENVLKLFQVLIAETSIQLWVTTRNHEKVILETQLGSCSYAMKEFTLGNQVEFLDSFWKHRTKELEISATDDVESGFLERAIMKVEDLLRHIEYEDSQLIESLCSLKDALMSIPQLISIERKHRLRSLIDELNFREIAKEIIQNSSIGNEESKFMGTPLHLFMLGTVVYDSNFKRGVYSNAYKLYTEFVEGKIKIYWKEKGKVEFETNITQKMFRFHRKEIINFHKDISQCVVEPSLYSWNSFMADEDRDADLSVGIVTRGVDNFQFIHRTFAEYFFAEKMFEKLKSRILDGKAIERILTDDEYSVVVRFLYWAVEGELDKGVMTKDILVKWDMFSLMKSCLIVGEYLVTEAKYLMKLFIDEMKKLCDSPLIDNFVFKMANVEVVTTICEFRIMKFCLNDSILFHIFETYSDCSSSILFSLVANCSAKDLKEVFCCLFRSTAAKLDGLDTSEHANVKKFPRVLRSTNKYNENTLFYAASNRDKDVFPYVLNIMKEYLSIDELKSFLTCVNDIHNNILHISATYFHDNIVIVIENMARILDWNELIPLLKGRSSEVYNFLFSAVGCNKTYVLRELFETLRILCDDEIFREIILKGASDDNIIHYSTHNADIESLVVVLEMLRRTVTEEEFLQQVRSLCSFGNIFHERAFHGHPITDLSVLKSYVGEEIFHEMLLEANPMGKTCLHVQYSTFGSACMTRLPRFKQCIDIILHDLRFLQQILDQTSLRKLLLDSDKHGNTILHYMVINAHFEPYFAILIPELKNVLENCDFETLLTIRNNSQEYVEITENGEFGMLKSSIPAIQ